MDIIKLHPLLLLSLFINAIAMGVYAYENYNENNIGYTVTFIVLWLFFIVLSIYGLIKNRTSK